MILDVDFLVGGLWLPGFKNSLWLVGALHGFLFLGHYFVNIVALITLLITIIITIISIVPSIIMITFRIVIFIACSSTCNLLQHPSSPPLARFFFKVDTNYKDVRKLNLVGLFQAGVLFFHNVFTF